MNPRARRRLTFAITLAALAFVAACTIVTSRTTTASSSPTTVAPADGRRPTLVMLGDSVTWAATPNLLRAFKAAGWDADVEAHPGDLFRDRQVVAQELAGLGPDIVVINLGTNDEQCMRANLPETGALPCRYPDLRAADITADMAKLLALFPVERTCVVGVLPTAAPGTTLLWQYRQTAGTVTGLADWGAESRAHVESLWDALGHLTEVGLENYSRFITDEVGRICQPKIEAVARG